MSDNKHLDDLPEFDPFPFIVLKTLLDTQAAISLKIIRTVRPVPTSEEALQLAAEIMSVIMRTGIVTPEYRRAWRKIPDIDKKLSETADE